MESIMGSEYIHIKIKLLLWKLESIKGFMIQIKILNEQKLPYISSIAGFPTGNMCPTVGT
jgi:hypothetical protein